MAEIADHKIDELISAINQLARQMGRGKGDSSVGNTGGKAGKANSGSKALDDAANLMAKQIAATTKKYGENSKEVEQLRKKLEKLNDSVKDGTVANKELSNATKDLEWQMKSQQRGIRRFGREMALGTGTLHQSLGGLADTFRGANTVVGKMLFGFAAGASFALGSMSDFAKDAAGVGGFADLGAFKVGSIRQAKTMSGLGDSFIKVITESNQGFKAFGDGSQEAIENLSDLSRGFRSGSNFTRTLNNRLGKEFVKDVDRASVAVSELGMSEEAQATLMASIAQQTALSGKRGDDAVKSSAKAFADTAESARKLSNTFGVSAEEVLKTINAFKRSQAGKTASTMGIKGAEDIMQSIMSAIPGMDEETASQAALLLQDEQTRGKGASQLLEKAGDEYADTINAIGRAAAAGGVGGPDGDYSGSKFREALRGEADGLIAGGKMGYNIGDLKYMSAKQAQLNFGTRMAMSEEQEAAEKKAKAALGGTTSEAGNIKSMNQLDTALNSLRSAVQWLNATMIGVLGLLTPLVFGGIGMALFGGSGGLAKIGSILGGALGKGAGAAAAGGKIVGGVFGKGAGAVGGALSTVGDKAGGMFGKLSDVASKGMGSFGDFLGKLGDTKTIRGAGTLVLLGAALSLTAVGLKKFNDVDWPSLAKGTLALGGLIFMAKRVGEATMGIFKGAAAIALLGAALLVSAVGFKSFNDVDWPSLAKGAIAIGILGAAVFALGKIMMTGVGALMFGVGLAALAALGVTAAGLGLALGIASVGMKPFAESLKSFGDISGSNLMMVGAGLGAIALGMTAFAAAAIVAAGGGIVSGMLGLVGSKGPLERIIQMAPMADQIKNLGTGIKNFGTGLIEINTGLKGFNKDALGNFKDQLLEFAEAGASDEVKLTAQYLTQIAQAMTQMKDAGKIQLPSISDMLIPTVLRNMPTAESLSSGASIEGNRLNATLLTPEILTQALGYLSSMVSDLDAIRGNTRGTEANTPVRLS